MILTLYFKGENDKIEPSRQKYVFDEETVKQLVTDFKNYATGTKASNGEPIIGGCYKVKKNSMGDEELYLFLNFEQLAYIG